jgi:hypothetical protein
MPVAAAVVVEVEAAVVVEAAAVVEAVVAEVDPVLETSVIINDVSAYHPSRFRNTCVYICLPFNDAREHKCVHPDGVRLFGLDYCRPLGYNSS